MKTTFLSKVVIIIARIEWGLKDIVVLSPHSFSAKSEDGREFSFSCQLKEHEEYNVVLDETDCDWIVLHIRNKKRGDNYVMLPGNLCGSTISFEEIARVMKRSWHDESNILHNRESEF